MPFNFGDEATNTGESTAVQCMINKGDAPINIKWVLNSEPLFNGQHGIVIVKMSTRLSSLSIDSITDKHRGIFKCIAENAAGRDEYESELKVNGRISFILKKIFYGIFLVKVYYLSKFLQNHKLFCVYQKKIYSATPNYALHIR